MSVEAEPRSDDEKDGHWTILAGAGEALEESHTVVVDQCDLIVAHKPAMYQSLVVCVAAEAFRVWS